MRRLEDAEFLEVYGVEWPAHLSLTGPDWGSLIERLLEE
jgi:hypothetical protein